MDDLAVALASLRSRRRATLAALAGLPDEAMPRPAHWRGAPVEVRFLLLRLADDDLARSVRVHQTLGQAGYVPSEGQRILTAVHAGRGRVMGSLVGLDPARFEQGWGEAEWSVRRVLGHVIATDRRYMIHTLHSVRRAHAGGEGPERPPAESLPDPHGIPESQGSMAEVMQRLEETHAERLATLAGLTDADLDAPTTWLTWNLDVRFRLLRFAEHDREHLVQLRKTYAAVGFTPSEAQRILEEASAARYALEGLLTGLPAQSPATPAAVTLLKEAETEEQELTDGVSAAVR